MAYQRILTPEPGNRHSFTSTSLMEGVSMSYQTLPSLPDIQLGDGTIVSAHDSVRWVSTYYDLSLLKLFSDAAKHRNTPRITYNVERALQEFESTRTYPPFVRWYCEDTIESLRSASLMGGLV